MHPDYLYRTDGVAPALRMTSHISVQNLHPKDVSSSILVSNISLHLTSVVRPELHRAGQNDTGTLFNVDNLVSLELGHFHMRHEFVQIFDTKPFEE